MFLAGRFGLVALIANGYRALAYVMLAIFVLPLMTIGVWQVLRRERATIHPLRSSRSNSHAKLRSLVIAATRLLAAPPQAAPPAGFEQRVEQLRQRYGVPGVTIAIVENGQTTLARARASREVGTRQPVDADTIFATGSTGKAFTVAALAILVDQGKIKWDDKVIDHMPDFRMYDPWVTREMTIRDLLVHRSGLGLGAGDLLFVPRQQPVARGDGAAAPLHQAGDQLPQRLCLRQHPLHGRRPADRGGQRPDLGAVRQASTSSGPLGMTQLDRVGRRAPANPNRARPHAASRRRDPRPRHAGAARREARPRSQCRAGRRRLRSAPTT